MKHFSPPASSAPPSRAWWLLPLLALLCSLALGWGVRTVYLEREQRYRHVIEGSLAAINQLQVGGVTAWRQRRMGEAASLTDDGLLTAAVTRWRQVPSSANAAVLRERLRGMVEHLGYTGAYLVDPQGRLLLGPDGPQQGGMPAPERDALHASLALAQPAVTGLQRDARFAFPYFGLLAPLYDGTQPLGAVWLVVDARATLYPLLATWPNSSHTAESFLVERQGDSMLFLSPLRHRGDEPLTLRMPWRPGSGEPIALAAGGSRGTLYGLDYRGEQVLATVAAVPGSNWLLISKIDAAEAFTEAQRREWLALGLFASLAALLLGGVVVLWRWRVWRRESALKERLEHNMRWLETAQRAASVGYFAYNGEQRVFVMSAMANAIFGLPAHGQMALRQWIDMLHADDREETLRLHGEAMAQHSPLCAQYRILRASDRHLRWVEVRAEYGDPQGAERSRMTGTIQDITERRQAEEQLERYRAALEAQIRIDPLTQLANRLALDEQVAFEWERAQRSGTPLALLMIDVDRFKAFNDHYGHVAGDRCLQSVALALSTATGRAGDVVARYGGEEFAVLLPGASEEQAWSVAERLREAVRALGIDHARGCEDCIVTISIGAASIQPALREMTTGSPRTGVDMAHALFRQADAALYRAKQYGRDQTMVYGPECDVALHDAPDSLL
ncbi:sensor domain-containing diguanylate cyclase [Pulveribacter suum]|uniref:diguanylate cyclase n=1 Tax=Pulveribacter suum TaxID=2116657 RepID=A0A2P1NIK7_9BURK|nr:diguanylate cyclase [Pulveribacter suum]AVP56894.1 sensor domain-containing diguanylate cyclase [Pulveribacter suum]